MEIPREDPASHKSRLVARVVRFLCVTRDAPHRWAKHVGGTIRTLYSKRPKGLRVSPGIQSRTRNLSNTSMTSG